MDTKEMNMRNRVVTDFELEKGEHPIGQVVHISTATHAWRGTLEYVTSSYFILSKDHPIALVDSTGAMGEYFAKPTAVRAGDAVEKPSARVFIPRGAVAWMIAW